MSETAPTVFLSYAWSDAVHNNRVGRLASALREAGIDVVYDQWDLEAGQDLSAFMERMVSDPSIDRVLVLLNGRYAEKADARTGGVGTETQIISPEVYADPKQTRFLPVVFEPQEPWGAVLPVYLRGRLYFDLSTDEQWAANWDRLVSDLYGVKPEKPPLGVVPQRVLDAFQRRIAGRPTTDRKGISALPSHRIHDRLNDLMEWHGIDHLRAAQLLAPFGFTLAALAQPERTLDLFSEEVVEHLAHFFQVSRGYLLGQAVPPGIVAGYWYKDVRPLCSRIARLHNADQLEAVRFVTARGSRVVNPKAKYREELDEDVTVVLVLKRSVGAFEFATYEVWETGTWTYEKCRIDLKAILLFCEQVNERRLLLQVAGATFEDKIYQAVAESQTHVAQVVGKGSWGRNWHPTAYVSSVEHLVKEQDEMPAVVSVYKQAHLAALVDEVEPRPV